MVAIGPFRNSCNKCEFCLKNWNNACPVVPIPERNLYGKYYGGYSTHIQINESHAYRLPNNIDHSTFGPLMCAGITTFLPLYLHAKKGERVAILGCGGLGHMGVQWAKKMGCEVHVFSSSHKKDELTKRLGSSKTVVWTQGEHKELQNHYDVILNTLPCPINQTVFNEFLGCLKPYGRFCHVGLPELNTTLVVDQMTLVLKSLSVIGSLVGGIQHYQDMIDFVEKHGIEVICEKFSWEEFPKALDKLENGTPMFRCVVEVAPVSDKCRHEEP